MLSYSLDMLSDCLPGVHAPTEPFDPSGEWELDYGMWVPARAKSGKSALEGSLRVRRRLTPDGKIRLHVTQVTRMAGTNGSGIVRGAVTCAPDELSTPLRWTLDSEIVNPQGKQVEYSAVSVSGRAEKGSIVLSGEKETRLKVSGRLSSNWSLLEAVQRLPFDSPAVEFTTLEELELLKPEQWLWPGAVAEVELGGRTVKLHSFEHVGRGILPWTYWLDDQHRLIIAVGQRRAFILDSTSTGEGGAK